MRVLRSVLFAMRHRTTVPFFKLFGVVPGWIALLIVLGGTAAATVPIFNGSVSVPSGGTINTPTIQIGSGYPQLQANFNDIAAIANAQGTPGPLHVQANGGQFSEDGPAFLDAPGLTSTVPLANPYFYNEVYLNNDQINAKGIATGVNGLGILHTFGGGTTAGSRAALYAELDLIGQTQGTTSTHDEDFVGVQSEPVAKVGEGGALGTERGNLFGFDANVVAQSGATNLFEAVGAEYDFNILTGSSVKDRIGTNVISSGNLQGYGMDAGYVIASDGNGTHWQNGIMLSNFAGGSPLATTGCLICTDGSVDTIGSGIDLSAYTISNYALKFKNGYWDGAGDIVLPGVLQVGAGKTISSSSGALGINSGSGSNLAVNLNGGAQTVFYAGGSTPYAIIGSNGLQLYNPVSLTCNGTQFLPCKFGWTVALSAATTGSTTQAVPSGATCTLTPTSTMLVSSTNMGTVSEGISGTTLTITVQTQLSATQSFGGVGTCI